MTSVRRWLLAHLPTRTRERLRLLLAHARENRLRRTSASLGVVLVYHRTGEVAGDPDFELDPAFPADVLRRQLDHLRSRYRPVAAERILEAAAARRPGEPFPVAVTLDDDLLSHVDVAARALDERGVPATVFVTGSTSHWWTDLQDSVDAGLLAPADLPAADPALVADAAERRPRALRRLARTIEALDPADRDEAAARLAALARSRRKEPVDVRALAAAGLAIGFHTPGHYDLRTLDDDALRREIATREGVMLIAYPHGKCDDRVAAAARAAGFELGFTGEARAVRASDDPLRLGRLQPTRGSLADFALQLTAALREAAS